jgi:hypothetical protein
MSRAGSPSVRATRAALGFALIARVGCGGSGGEPDAGEPFDTSRYEDKILALYGHPDDLFGHAIAAQGDALIGAPSYDGAVHNGGAAYIYDRFEDGFGLVARLVAPDAADDDNFGYAVARAGASYVVGARYHDHAGLNAGAVYVFERTGDELALSAELLVADAADEDGFGQAVAADGDLVVVGAAGVDGAVADIGAAYVYERRGADWALLARLTASAPVLGQGFGNAVAVDGDRLIVGAPFDDAAGAVAGAVYVFERSGDDFVEAAKLVASGGDDFDYFGASVALRGDRIAVGAWGDSVGGDLAGAAYVYRYADGAWVQAARVTAPQPRAYDNFGNAVAIEADRVVVGAHFDDDNGRNSGTVYVFEPFRRGYALARSLIPEDGLAGDEFGIAVALDGARVFIGSFRDDTDGIGIDSGSVYTYDL